MGTGAGMAIAFELEGGPAGGAGSESGGREIGVRHSVPVETGTEREKRGFGFGTITGGRTVGEEAAGATATASACELRHGFFLLRQVRGLIRFRFRPATVSLGGRHTRADGSDR
jgi:hypothetical protein